MPGISETETVVKRVLPYLQRRGYDVDKDLTFELHATSGKSQRFVDICVTAGTKKPSFVIEAKRQSHRLTAGDREKALEYGRILKVPFVVLTNGIDLELINTATGKPLQFNNTAAGKAMIPHKSQLQRVLKRLRDNPEESDLRQADPSLPYRPGLPLKQLNALFARCHSKIRTLEKDEENAFADFSKFLFLRLLEEKADDPNSGFSLPYSTLFYELAQRPAASHDEVKSLVDTMIEYCRKQYGEVITRGLHIKRASTYAYLVAELSAVSFTDSGLDTKGAAFEYFVRTTLKGKKLGQYFTPRPLVELMLEMVGRDLIVGTLASGEPIKVLDPACGTGGFLVFWMKHALDGIEVRCRKNGLTPSAAQSLSKKVMEHTFYGIDANPGVASSAKMNMIISGDGHTNITCGNSLADETTTWSLDEAEYDLIISNPPFGTSEADIPADFLAKYPIKTTKGQLLFLQHMVLSTKPRGLICTVIDDGTLNTDTAAATRRWIMEHARVKAVVSLPAVTFKPNKITVKASVLLLERFDETRDDPGNEYQVTYAKFDTLGFDSSGELLRNFDFETLRADFRDLVAKPPLGHMSRNNVTTFPLSSYAIVADGIARLDYKYWDVAVQERIKEIIAAGGQTLAQINTIDTGRGSSPKAALYVDQADGYASVLKAGSSITPWGEVIHSGDWIEKAVYDEMDAKAKVQNGDILLASTGDGTLGKCAVYEEDKPAIADGHITVIRVNPAVVDPWFLADYLREGFGRVQANRLFTGSTGLIELAPEKVKTIVVPTYLTLASQRLASETLRKAEAAAHTAITTAETSMREARSRFAGLSRDDDG